MTLPRRSGYLLPVLLCLAIMPWAHAADSGVTGSQEGDTPETATAADTREESEEGGEQYLERLARIEEQNGEFDLSMSNYLAVVRQVEANEGIYSERLIEPLTGVGRVAIEQQMYDEAVDALRRAQHISHRAEGVHTLRQLEVLDLMTRIHIEQDDPLAADREQRFGLYLSEHAYGDDGPELLDALYKLAEWYMATGQFMRARHVYERAVDIVASHFGEEDKRLIEPYRGIAYARQLQGSLRGYEVLERAIAIMKHCEDYSAADLAGLTAELGDAYLVARKSEDALGTYREAWRLLETPDEAEPREILFGAPTPIAMTRSISKLPSDKRYYALDDDSSAGGLTTARYPTLGRDLRRQSDDEVKLSGERPPQVFRVSGAAPFYRDQIRDLNEQTPPELETRRVVGEPLQFLLDQLLFILPGKYRDPEELGQLYVDVEFTVDPDGSVRDVVTTDTNAPPKLPRVVADSLSRSYFRPRMAEGEPVTTEHVQLKQVFR